jgi:hypothetical protein
VAILNKSPTPKTDRLREMREERYASDQKQKALNNEQLPKAADGDEQKAPKPKRK